jgi:hypothetical protein
MDRALPLAVASRRRLRICAAPVPQSWVPCAPRQKVVQLPTAPLGSLHGSASAPVTNGSYPEHHSVPPPDAACVEKQREAAASPTSGDPPFALHAVSGREQAVLGVDLASRRWSDIGTALVKLGDDGEPIEVVTQAVRWPLGAPLTESRLARIVDRFVRAHGVAAVSIDGPQGWRDPAALASQGVGRACEKSAHAPGKTGVYGRTYPANQLGWMSFSITLFALLTERNHIHLVDDPEITTLEKPKPGEYYLMECFPTVTWRSAGLAPLPAKRRVRDTRTFATELATRWPLPLIDHAIGHDDLQAVVAALPAIALLGCGHAVAHGASSTMLPLSSQAPAHRVEGIIWDALPPAGASTAPGTPRAPSR